MTRSRPLVAVTRLFLVAIGLLALHASTTAFISRSPARAPRTIR